MTKSPDVTSLIQTMAEQIQALVNQGAKQPLEIVGIRTGGVWVAEKLNEALNRTKEIGELNISFYRDDFTQIGLHPQVSPSSLPFSIDNKHLLLVDDVLMSGRTVRAAMNELFDYGRPASISLAVMIDLQRRELPIAPDIVGQRLQLGQNERIKICGPKPLSLEIQTVNKHDSNE